MEFDDPDDIIGFKRPPRSTNADYRSKPALDAAGALKLRRICSNIKNEQDFQWQIVALLEILTILKLKATSRREEANYERWFIKTMNDSSSTESDNSSLSNSTTSTSTISTSEDNLSILDIINKDIMDVYIDDEDDIDYGRTISMFSLFLDVHN